MVYIFLDESGIHKQDGISCIALVYVITHDLETLERAIIAAEQDLNVDFFHWKDHGWKIRKKFSEKIHSLNFSLKSFIFKNPFNDSKYEKAAIHLLVENDIECLIIDGKKSRQYRNEFRKVLRMKGVFLKKFKTGNDRSYPALRIADFCAGLLRTYHEDPDHKITQELYDKLKPKILVTFLD